MIVRIVALFFLSYTLVYGSPLPDDSFLSDEDLFFDKMSLANASYQEGFFAKEEARPKRSLQDAVTFFLYNDMDEEPVILSIDDENCLENSTFDETIPTKIVIHGWEGNAYLPWVIDFKDTYLNNSAYNVIIVDWNVPAGWSYTVAVRATAEIGDHLADLLRFIQRERQSFSFNDVHIVGYSLGAHIAGYAGRNLNGELGRITALDAAAPLFEFFVLVKPEKRLDPTDAKFVDCIHTNGGGPSILGMKFALGFERPLGHIDFFPNGGGLLQPGCDVLSPSCNHKRSHELMLESIRYPKNFPSVKCGSYRDFEYGNCDYESEVAYMGEFVSRNIKGSFFLDTNSNSPYGKASL